MKSVNSAQAYDYIRKRILSGEYPSGYSLAENALSGVIGISRTPVHDALRQLEADGLVTIQSRLGASVKRMDLNEFKDMCGLRIALESHAAGLAALNRTEQDLAEIANAVEAMRKLTALILVAKEERDLVDQIRQEDIRFHVGVMAAAKNILMKKEILRLHLINRVVSSPIGGSMSAASKKADVDARRKTAQVSHETIWRAIKTRNVAGAKEEMERHINHHLERMALSDAGLRAKALAADELSYNSH
jgi:DNA-binding GntR family transcriptional regulator